VPHEGATSAERTSAKAPRSGLLSPAVGMPSACRSPGRVRHGAFTARDNAAMNTAAGITDHDREELRLLYETTASEIVSFKQQQWSTTNYALTLQAAFVLIGREVFRSPSAIQVVFLLFLVWLVVAAAFLTNRILEGSIKERRPRMDRCRGYFGKAFNDARGPTKRPLDIHPLLLGFVVASGVVASSLILTKAL